MITLHSTEPQPTEPQPTEPHPPSTVLSLLALTSAYGATGWLAYLAVFSVADMQGISDGRAAEVMTMIGFLLLILWAVGVAKVLKRRAKRSS